MNREKSNRKVITLTIISLFIVVFLSTFASAIMVISYECEDKNCIEGSDIHFDIDIENNLDKPIVVGELYLKELIYKQNFLLPLEAEIVLEPGERHTERYTMPMPRVGSKLKDSYTLTYWFCMKVGSVGNTGVEVVSEVCNKVEKTINTIPASQIWCTEDSECNSNEYCNTNSLYKCKPVVCPEGQRPKNHVCVDVKCAWNEVYDSEEMSCVEDSGAVKRYGNITLIALLVILVAIYLKKKKKD